MNINSKIKLRLEQAALPVEKCLLFLLGTYFNVPTKDLSLQKTYILQMVKLGILSTVGAVYSVPSLFTDEEVAGTAYTIEEDVMTYIDTYRKLFIKANDRPGMMGDRNQVYLKLCRWLHINPGYTMQDIITKTREYIARKQEIGEQMYLQQADYLVYKITNGEEKSVLSAIIDEDFTLVTFEKQI